MATPRKRDTGNRPSVGTGPQRKAGTTAGQRRVATGAYRPSGGRGSTVAVLVAAAFLAAGLGAIIALKDDLFGPPPGSKPPSTSQGRPKPPPSEPVKPPPSEPVNPPPSEPVEPPPAEPPPAEPPPPPENGLAGKAMAEGQKHLVAREYPRATATFKRVRTLKCSDDFRKKAEKLADKAEAFEKLTGDVKPRQEVGQAITMVELIDGRKFPAVLTDNKDGTFEVLEVSIGGSPKFFPVTDKQLRSREKIDPAAWRAKLVAELETRETELGRGASPADLVEVAVFALENGLGPESHGLLEKAWTAAERLNAGLLLTVYEARAGQLFAKAIWLEDVQQELVARKYCRKILNHDHYKTTSFAEKATKLMDLMDARNGIKNYEKTVVIIEEPEPVVLDPRKPVRPPPAPTYRVTEINSSKSDLSEANRLFEEGVGHYVKGRPGNPNFNQHLSKASELFRKSREIYERAAQSDPGNSRLQSRLQDLNMKIYACAKMSTL